MNAQPDAPCPAPSPDKLAQDGAYTLPAIALLNVTYSPNLGDGLLCECLERELGLALPGCRVVSVDLAGRSGHVPGRGALRGVTLALLDRCPPAIRFLVSWMALHLLILLRLRRHYRSGLEGARVVIVGGGNLFTDTDLNFPLKIGAALAEARRQRIPVAVYAVGVSARWSRWGTRTFARALEGAQSGARPIWASARDVGSQRSWQAHFAGMDVPEARLTLDPGILASKHYPRSARHPDDRRIGLCITDPLAVRYHGGRTCAENLETWYPDALRSLVTHGFEVVLFTNGSPEDRNYLHSRLHDWVRHARGPVVLGRSFETPADLAGLVSGCEAIVAHRMHACIAAYSFGIPALGLRWDEKLDSFFDLTGRSAHMLDPATTAGTELGLRAAAAIADRFDPTLLIARAGTQVRDFAAMLEAKALGGGGAVRGAMH